MVAQDSIKQNEDVAAHILHMFENEMNDVQKEAFLLGRIYTLLNEGNDMAKDFNAAIKKADKSLDAVQKKIYTANKVADAAKPIPKKKAPAKKTTVKEKKNK